MQTLTDYLPLYGKWTKENDSIVFTSVAGEQNNGLALFGYDLEDGEIEAEINLSGFPEDHPASAMIVFRANGQRRFYAAGVGGLGSAYSLPRGGRPATPYWLGMGWQQYQHRIRSHLQSQNCVGRAES